MTAKRVKKDKENGHKKRHDVSPGRKAWRKFWRNRLAVFGAIVIMMATLVASLGSLIRPDNTEMAQYAIPNIAYQTPGFKLKMIKERQNKLVEQPGIFGRMFFGGIESEYRFWALTDYEIDGFYVRFREFNATGNESIEVKHLANILYPLELDNKFITEDDKVTFFVMGQGKVTMTQQELVDVFESESVIERTYWLGTDGNGRDMLSRLMAGTIISLMVGFIAVLISLGIGLSLGAMAGFFRGFTDKIVMYLINVVGSIPPLLLVIAFTMAFGKGYESVFIAVGLTMWVELARLVRGQVLSIREKEFIEAGRAMGFNSFRLITKHVIPNIIGPVIVVCAANFANAILIEAGLSFLGIGTQPPQPSWGVMISDYKDYINSDGLAYLPVLPGVCIVILVLAFMLVGNGIRDALDNKSTNISSAV
jgi:peptide/nickel transport system permease protein